MDYALINDGVIENITVINDAEQVAHFEPMYDDVVRIDELESRPSIGWTYDGEDFAAPVVSDDVLMAALRERRNELLSASDYTQLADAPYSVEEKAAWVIYRQALRDMTEQEGLDLANPAWPIPPEA